MALEGDLVAVVTPRELQIWSAPGTKDDVPSHPNRSFPFHHSVGFATCIFDRSLPGGSSTKLFLAISGQDGIFAYSITMDQLRTGTLASDLSPAWSIETAASRDADSKRCFDDPYRPLLGANGASVSWLLGCYASRPDQRRHVRFATMVTGVTAMTESQAGVAEPLEYQLEHPDMPAMYASGVYDYDDGLGLAVFGNGYGELALFDLVGLDLKALQPCFKPISTSPASFTYEIMPQVRLHP